MWVYGWFGILEGLIVCKKNMIKINNKKVLIVNILVVTLLVVVFMTSFVDLSFAKGDVKLHNPINTSDIPTLIGKVINWFLGIAGSLALVMFIVGGVMWMTAGGSKEQVGKGTHILAWASLGLLLIFSSYAILNFVFLAFK